VWFIRAALAYLMVGFGIGGLLLVDKASAWPLRPAHIECLLMGWTVQLVLGVALWIFPRFRLGSLPHGPLVLAWWSFALLNAGVWAVALGVAPAVGRALEAAAVVLCVANLWKRVRPGLSQM
jgi:hypothetical protein